jgi:hypothetical protein|tara:strand:- start:19 stop:222 length:204 start_codon:yes stop_codon:yes gene_type:complete
MLISMQVACGCCLDAEKEEGFASATDPITAWDGPDTDGFVEGRRYLWRCQACGNTICVNLTLPEVKE